MGNSTSTHNLNINSKYSGELYSQAQQQQRSKVISKNSQLSHRQNSNDAASKHQLLRRSQHYGICRGAEEWTKSLPHVPSSFELHETVAQFKVLPEISKPLQLRTTTNGSILHAGGTISGRKEQAILPLKGKDNSKKPSLPLMQRSHTLIHDHNKVVRSHSGDESHYKFQHKDQLPLAPPAFRRAQTLLHMNYGNNLLNRKTNSNGNNYKKELEYKPREVPANMAENFNERTSVATTPKTNSKTNKYNKKRKAPAAPLTMTESSVVINSQKLEQQQVPNESKEITMKTRIFRGNAIKMQHQDSLLRSSTHQRLKDTAPKLPYRREKSSDAILFGRHLQRNEKETTIKSCEHKTENSVPVSKIPQLKRTFYFGMNVAALKSASSENRKQDLQNEEKKKLVNEQNMNMMQPLAKMLPLNDSSSSTSTASSGCVYKLEDITETKVCEEIGNTLGLQVRLRPTLPRRQLEPPSFSPSAAWHGMASEQQKLQRSAQQTNRIQNEQEAPIQLKKDRTYVMQKKYRTAWTPQQDLDDEEEDDDAQEFIAIKYDAKQNATESDSSSDEFHAKDEGDGLMLFGTKSNRSKHISVAPTAHVFSLSLPRESHIMGLTNSQDNELTGFNSLQKCKNVFVEINPDLANTTANVDASFHRNDNWVLHKTKLNNNIELGSLIPLSTLNKPKWDSAIAAIEPKSLTYLTGGKHVMYLPGQNQTSATNCVDAKHQSLLFKLNRSNKETSAHGQHKKNTQRERESLQDVVAITTSSDNVEQHKKLHLLPINATNAEKQQRFSFQSTVRLLERRRLAEKLTKDAEIREAQRKSELEAMKRVEEDFQRKRAFEKANIRHQLQLYYSSGNETSNIEQYNSLPITTENTFAHYDTNNNVPYGRAEPDGAVATSPTIP